MMAVLEQRVFDGLGAADEQAAEQAVLFLGDPLAAAVAADEDDGGRTTARWRFDELHVGIPFQWRSSSVPRGRGPRVEAFLPCDDWGVPAEGCMTHAANIRRAEYEFEGGRPATS